MVREMLIQNYEYLQDYLVRMAHHSTAIEGNTLTQDQTANILLNGIISKQYISEREFFEVRNYKKVMPFILESVRNNINLTLDLIREIHSIVMENLLDNAGSFKTIQNVILGANFETTKPYLVPTRMHQFCEDLYLQLQRVKSEDDKLKIILKSHFDFERIHPFSDGNGRVGRLLIFYVCLQENIIPPMIQKEQKDIYIACLREQDLEGLFKLAKEMQENESKKIKTFIQS